jgi:hypothetical protein
MSLKGAAAMSAAVRGWGQDVRQGTRVSRFSTRIVENGLSNPAERRTHADVFGRADLSDHCSLSSYVLKKRTIHQRVM